MIKPVVLVILVLAAFLAAVLNLAAESRFRNTVMGCAIVAAVGIGAIFYGSGYAYSFGLNATSLMRALLTLCRTFGGVNDFGSIQASPLLFTSLTLFPSNLYPIYTLLNPYKLSSNVISNPL